MSQDIVPSSNVHISAEQSACKQQLNFIFNYYNTIMMEALFPGLHKNYRHVDITSFELYKLLDERRQYPFDEIIKRFNELETIFITKLNKTKTSQSLALQEVNNEGFLELTEPIDPMYKIIEVQITDIQSMRDKLYNLQKQCPGLFTQGWGAWASSWVPAIPGINS